MRSFGAILLPLRFNKIIGGATSVAAIEKVENLEKAQKVEKVEKSRVLKDMDSHALICEGYHFSETTACGDALRPHRWRNWWTSGNARRKK
jgi:hypothetical protein